MAEQDSWIRAEMGGTKRSSVISKPEVLVALLKKAKRPLILIGHETIDTDTRTDTLIRLLSIFQHHPNVSVLSTAHIAGKLISKGITPTATLGSMEILDRLRDPTWNGLDGKGQYDLIFMAGFSYSLGWLILSGLRQGAISAKVVSLDPKYHPHATWSYGNMKDDIWKKEIEQLIELINPEKKMKESYV